MLGFFPRLYQDELLYSLLARYHVYSMNLGPKQTMEDLFGRKNELAVPDLPVNLLDFHLRVKHFMIKNPMDLIKDHTFFAFYTAFQHSDARNKVMNSMLQSHGNKSLQMLTGVMASSIKEKEYFHYCSLCFAEDIRTMGESYWRLLHQLPGVLTCTKHRVLLSESLVPFRPHNRHEFIASNRENCPAFTPLAVYTSKTMYYLDIVSNELTDLMTGKYMFDPDSLRQIYRSLLNRMGFMTAKGRINQVALVERFRAFYGDECLELLQSKVDKDNPFCWLKSFSRRHKSTFHPIRHILFIHFLGSRLNLLSQEEENGLYPFGREPFPCLNRASDHYMKPVIYDLIISRCTDTGKPVGTFTCSCGFVYSRRGPDLSVEDRMKIGRIKRFGDIWMGKLRELLDVEKLSYRATARHLGVDTNTIIKYDKNPIQMNHVTKDDSLQINQHRADWVVLVNDNPDYSVTRLKTLKPRLYAWLYRNDYEWIMQNSPKRLRSVKINERIDWIERDKRLVKEVQKVHADLILMTPLTRITISKISTLLRRRTMMQMHLDKLPRTKKIIEQSVETVEQFQCRRVRWAAKVLVLKNEDLSDWKIRRLAGLGKLLTERVEIEIYNVIENSNIGVFANFGEYANFN